MRANIIIHSVSGNLFLIADSFREKLQEKGIETKLYRVEDIDLHLEANERNEVNQYYEEIIALPIASPSKLGKADLIILACPSCFGMPSAEMMAFLKKTEELRESGKLSGKVFYPYASALDEEDAKRTCYELMHWALKMGMDLLPFAPYIHKEGRMMPNRPSDRIDETAEKLASVSASMLG
ncbi:MAG: NAD(P)H-dependent oxidoreductase [Candidatus Ornithospirochaeta sp.]|nr:NAD(P)H-dependent oxidoreductase [Candidatus Ornithospirochaeta sp.]